MNAKEYDADIVIVGAGIHGAAIASEACRRDFDVILLEQYAGPAQGTSSRSSKLIHGGLRYLESMELGLVYECLRDRRRLLKLYPDLVTLQKFYLPVYQGASRPPYLLHLGLSLYALLGGLDKAARFRKLRSDEWASLDDLSTNDLLDVFQYHDAQTDDAALTARLLEEGGKDGLKVIYGADFEFCDYDRDHVTVSYTRKGESSRLRARYLVNAAGPWVNQVIKFCRPGFASLPIDLVQGAHIELPGSLEQGFYYLEAPQDQRAVFVMPWQEHILVGTTETIYTGDPGECKATASEINYLLGVFNHYFGEGRQRMTEADVIDSWAGLRVLPRGEGRPFKRSRETIFHPNRKDSPNIFSIYGGKLTSHHSTALKLLRLLD